MPIFDLFNKQPAQASAAPKAPTQSSFVQEKDKAGLLVTDELEKALEECKAKVARIAKDCRARNRKYRDFEFDLEDDKDRCLHNLGNNSETYSPSDVQRVTQIFDNPQFFIDGADSNDIVQGAIGDCWFVSALATMSTWEGLVEKFCVARDEQVGVYGFIFFRDGSWVTVIIDDLLYTQIPKFEELSWNEKQLYHNNKDIYNSSARKGGKSLYFAKSGTEGETWVPLIEKAYAKLHGSYAALCGGEACEAIEDLTGGVSCFIASHDILDTDRFWNEELLKANKDRLFGCAYQPLDGTRSGDWNAKISGLIGNHAYSVLRAVEHNGKRFVIVRNPWGESEWTGPWSDGSKEWIPEWLEALPALGHSFGDDGQFVMEYKDFLACWDQIDRTLLFDSSWVMSAQWLHVTAKPLPTAWTFGDVSFTFTLPKSSLAIIVLSQIDSRFFNEISGRSFWTFDFVVFKKGEKDLVAQSSHSRLYARSVNLEVELEAGDYVVHVRLDRHVYRDKDYFQTQSENWDQRVLSRVLTQRAQGQSVAANFKKESQANFLPMTFDELAGQDLAEIEQKALAVAKAKKKEEEEKAKEEEEKAKKKAEEEAEEARKKAEAEEAEAKRKAEEEEAKRKAEEEKAANTTIITNADGSVTTRTVVVEKAVVTVTKSASGDVIEDKKETLKDTPTPDQPTKAEEKAEQTAAGAPTETKPDPSRDLFDVSEENSIFLGLRVYTKKEAPVVITGQLRHEMELSAEAAAGTTGTAGTAAVAS